MKYSKYYIKQNMNGSFYAHYHLFQKGIDPQVLIWAPMFLSLAQSHLIN